MSCICIQIHDLTMMQIQPHNVHVDWKGPWFHEIGPITAYNRPTDLHLDQNAGNIFRSLPIKHYRRELPGTKGGCSNANLYHNPGRLSDINRPGGMITHSSATEFRQDIIAPIIPPSEQCAPNADGQCMSSQINARKRVRSAGMLIKPKPNTYRETGEYYVTGHQYLYSRNKTAVQNSIHIAAAAASDLKPGAPNTYNNVYSSGTATAYCGGNESTEYPVYYKPNNFKYAQQGAVSSSDKIFRLKYDTITYGGQAVNTPFGILKPSALAYAVNGDTYRLKDKIGTQMPYVPTILPNETEMRNCSSSKMQ